MVDDEIEITIPRWAWILAVILLLVTVGYFVSPVNAAGRPIFLSPEVKAISDFRNSATAWEGKLREIDSQLVRLLSGAYGSDLFEKSRQSQAVVEATSWLLQEVERVKAPTAASPLRELVYRATTVYLEAARATLVWIGEPTTENLSTAQAALDVARAALQKMERSEWLHQTE